MNQYLKDNMSLVVALLLPIIFAGFFYASKIIGSPTMPPPAYDVVLAQNTNSPYEIKVIDGELKVTFTYPQRNDKGLLRQNFKQPDIYFVDHQSLIAEPIYLEPPADAGNPPPEKENTRIEIPLQRFNGQVFTAASIAPDGYELETGRYRDGNLMTEIFASNRRSRDNMARLVNKGSSHDIKGVSQSYGIKVVGWIKPQ